MLSLKNLKMDKQFIRISQFNVESIQSKKPLLIDFLTENDVDICLLNETWLQEGNHFRLPGYMFISQNCKNKKQKGGSAICIKNSLRYKVVNTPYYDYMQSVAIIIYTDVSPLSILCTYCPPEGSRFKACKLKQIINNLPKPLLLSGDLNAHHLAFGCDRTKSRGTAVYNLIEEYDLCILNTGSPTTVGSPKKKQSAIDISCISSSLAPLCYWKVHSDAMGSYHYPTIIDIYMKVQKFHSIEFVDKYLYKKTDWLKYMEISEKEFKHFIIDDNNPLNTYENFIEILTKYQKNMYSKIKKA